MLLIKYIISIEYWNYIFCRLCRLPLRKGGGGETYPGVGVYGPCEENDQDESHHLCGAELPYPHRLRTIRLQNRTTGDQGQVWPKIHKSTNYRYKHSISIITSGTHTEAFNQVICQIMQMYVLQVGVGDKCSHMSTDKCSHMSIDKCSHLSIYMNVRVMSYSKNMCMLKKN